MADEDARIGNGALESAPPDFSDIFGAFERDSDADERAINAVVGALPAYQFPAVEGYTPYDDPHADQDLIDRHMPRFLGVKSPDACRAMEYRLKREENEAELVCSSGWMGAVAAASIGRPALATWTPGRSEYVAGELKYRPGYGTLTYGFPDVDPATFAEFGGGDGGAISGGGGDRRKSKKRRAYVIHLPEVVVGPDEKPEPPPPDAPGGTATPYDPPTRHEINAPAVENVEAPRIDPPLANPETLSSPLRPVVDQPVGELPAPQPTDSARVDPEEPNAGTPSVAVSNPEQLTAGQQAPEAPALQPARAPLSWGDRFKLSQTVAEYSSVEGAGRLYHLATVAKWLEENPEATDTDLLTKFNPGLLRIRWAERRQAMVDYLRNASALLEDVRQQQADYEAMESTGSLGDFTAWLAGQVTGGWRSPETWAGGSSKGASLFGRALWTGLKQAGIAAGSDAVAQWLLVKAGFQKEFNPVQPIVTGVTAGTFNAGAKAGADTVRLGVKKVVVPEDLAVWDRLRTVGRTPGKSSATGRAVIERMGSEGKIRDDPTFEKMFQASDGEWYPFNLGDMSHNTDAVSWWNAIGRNYGAKAPEVRKWMLDSANYTIDRSSINRSAGAKLGKSGVRYLPPNK